VSADVLKSVDPVLETKLHRPPLPHDLVRRENLIALLDKERSRPLTLVSAPAGYGKSILVASWLEHSDWPSTWLSLDVGDGDLRTFLTYVVAALRKTFADVCEQTQSLLKARDLPSVNTLAAVLSNELDDIERPFILVIDDYHRIDASSAVHDLLERLLAHPPIPLHLVIVSRSDPPLSLARLRALGQMTDIRVLDLRLNLPETRMFLQRTVRSDASETALANLDRELEGWVAGLKLVALALRNSSDADKLLSRFRGGTRDIQAYLVGEVLNALPEDERDCLTRTALLDRFCAPLCEAVCGQPQGGNEFLQSAYKENLFIIPLDSQGVWFRYHHLFQELLQRELTSRLDSREIRALHMAASRWFDQHDLVDEAIRHALAADDEPAAVNIVERHRHAQLNLGNWYVLERWLEMLPSIAEQSPDLLLARAWIAYESSRISAMSDILQRAADLFDARVEGTSLWGEYKVLQGASLYWSGEAGASQECFAVARGCLSQEHRLYLGLANTLEGMSYQMLGDTQKALDFLGEHLRKASRNQGIYYSRMISGLYFTYMFAGDLDRARSETLRIESVGRSGGMHYAMAWSVYMRACTFLHCYDLEQAARHFADAARQCYVLHKIAAVDCFAGLALCQQLLGQQDAAKKTVQQLLDFARELNDPSCLEIAQSCQARCAALRGDAASGLVWAGNNSEPARFAEMFMWLEVPALTRVRVWIALGSDESLNQALDLLREISARNQSWNLVNQEIEAGALRSIALEKLDHAEKAVACLGETLQLAAPGGWVRPFLEQGPAMAALMARLDKQHDISDFGRHVMSVFSEETAPEVVEAVNQPGVVESDSGIPETLTNRELAILELLAQRLQNKEIAARLFVSPETVKSHLKRLYDKLNVHNRRDAAAIAVQVMNSRALHQ